MVSDSQGSGYCASEHKGTWQAQPFSCHAFSTAIVEEARVQWWHISEPAGQSRPDSSCCFHVEGRSPRTITGKAVCHWCASYRYCLSYFLNVQCRQQWECYRDRGMVLKGVVQGLIMTCEGPYVPLDAGIRLPVLVLDSAAQPVYISCEICTFSKVILNFEYKSMPKSWWWVMDGIVCCI